MIEMADTLNLKGKLKETPSPHIRTARTSQWVMTQVLIALIPPAIAATYFFGIRVLWMLVLGIGSAVLSEYIYQKAAYQKVRIKDMSAAVTGTLVALSLPVTAPWWTIMIGSMFAILLIKHLIGGGLGRNYFNPAVSARVMLKAFFTPWITNWVLPGPDVLATATPLEFIGNGAQTVSSEVPGLMDLFLGVNLGGNVGETSKLAILIGMLYLIGRKIINPKIPILYILTTMLVVGFWSGFDFQFMMTHALTGTLFFGATYMATDYSSGCFTPQGKTVFAIGCGVLTGVIRIAFNFPGAVGFSILIMNALAPMIDNKLMPRIYGHDARPAVSFDRQAKN